MTGPESSICPGCGASSWGNFCGRCGRPLGPATGAQQSPSLPPPSTDSHGTARVVGIGVVCVLAAVTIGLGYRVLSRDDPGPGSSASAGGAPGSSTASGTPTRPSAASPATTSSPDETSVPTAPTETATVTVSATSSPAGSDDEQAQQAAYQTLRDERTRSLNTVFLDGRWVLQLSSKYNGLNDKLQYAENGSHTFYYRDILAEHTRIKALLAQQGWPSLTLLATDFGSNQSASNTNMWVLLGDPGGISSQADAQTYCQALYPERTGEYLKNVCLPRRLYPPSS